MSRSSLPPSSRRQFLVGANGFALALPFLPSLLPREAQAASTGLPRLFWICTGHGAASETNMFPSASMADNTISLFPDHPVRVGALQGATNGGSFGVSPILQASSANLTPTLLRKMNVLRGLDVPFSIAHNTGLHLGNYARNNGDAPSGQFVQGFPRPTIDQILAWSPQFYSSLAGVKERVIVVGGPGDYSWNYANPMARSGGIIPATVTRSTLALFGRVFVPGETPKMMATRPPIVDRVLANYKSLSQSNKRLSAEDKVRLDNHMAALSELQRKLTVGTSAACGSMSTPTDDADRHGGNNPTDYVAQARLYNDVIAAAFACGASRLAVHGSAWNEQARAVAYGGSWHQDIAHRAAEPDSQAKLVQAYRVVFEGLFLDLARKLDGIADGGGKTVLDNTLMAWTQECGSTTHSATSIPVITFGSAAGAFKTGMLFDYRRTGNPKSASSSTYQGLLYNQWLATVLGAMGLPASEWERWGHKGYGYPYVSQESYVKDYRNHYVDTSSRYFTMASDPLPGLRA